MDLQSNSLSVRYFSVVLFFVLWANFTLAQHKKPNVILILVDDMGYSDIGAYGSEIHTPNIDKLAREGIRLQQFYNNSICAPTRASLLTGQYQHKAGVGYFDVNLGLPAYQGYLNKESLTLAEVFGNAGYNTYMSGKWHVGRDSSGRQWPVQRGFSHFFGFLPGASAYRYYQRPLEGFNEPGPFYEDDKRVSFRNEKDFYLTDKIADYAVKYIDDAATADKPFFLYVAFNAPHWPLQAPEEEVKKYEGKYHIGWDSLRTLRLQGLKAKGLLDDRWQPAANDSGLPAWKDITDSEKKDWERKMEVFAAMVDKMDQGVGKILGELKKTGKEQNTLVVFLSDNGAPGEDFGKFGGFGGKDSALAGTKVGEAGSFQSQGKNWSHVSNSPFKKYKAFAYEGGISTPLIVRLPGIIPANKLAKGDAHIVDIAPTLYDMADVVYPAQYHHITPNKLAGVSIAPILTGKADAIQDRPLFWERAGNRAVQLGKWKIVSIFPSKTWELYNIEDDRGETNDLAASHPDIVQKYDWLYQQWAKDNGVVDFETLKDKVPQRRP
ncbi:MAG: arylsulfatase [Chitinophagaceae bacterium]